METRIENYVKALAYKDTCGQLTFPCNIKEKFVANGNDPLVSVPVKGSITVDCSDSDAYIDIDCTLLSVSRDDDGMLTVTYLFNGDVD